MEYIAHGAALPWGMGREAGVLGLKTQEKDSNLLSVTSRARAAQDLEVACWREAETARQGRQRQTPPNKICFIYTYAMYIYMY